MNEMNLVMRSKQSVRLQQLLNNVSAWLLFVHAMAIVYSTVY